MRKYRLKKTERISKKKIINTLFEGGSKSFCIYPIRMVYTLIDNSDSPVSILITVPKRKMKNAVDRNRIKRQVREAYRQKKKDLIEVLEKKENNIIVGFIYVGDKLYSSERVSKCIDSLLCYLIEKYQE